MKPTRREVVEAALAAAIAAATPASIYAVAERSVSPDERFLLVALRDGRFLAIDRFDDRRAYLLTELPAPDGEYALSKSGDLIVRGGELRGVHGTAACTGYAFVQAQGAIEVKDARGRVVSTIRVSPPPRRG
jgi:hypothetical protein